MAFSDGTLHAINWAANVLFPCLGVLFFCAAVYCYGQPHMRYTHFWYAGWGAFLIPGIVRLFEGFTVSRRRAIRIPITLRCAPPVTGWRT